ncbi:MAG: FAD-dependent oxidoreductase [Chthoniobacteraceae bacterium]
MTSLPAIILGAGLTGLSCALHLGRDYLLVEKESEPGGIVRTRVRETPAGDFHCDGTGHWLHFRNAEIRTLVERLLPGGLVEYERRAVIHMCGAFTLYPFQANTYGLPREVVLDCLLGLLRARHPEDFNLPPIEGTPRNFRESLERLFGDGICRHFMVPYNEKLLGVSLDEISPEYAGRFIPKPSLEAVVRGALGLSPEALGYNAKFSYPRTGGIGALSKAFAAALPTAPRLGVSATAIDLRAKTVTFSDGTQSHYERLLNTMPLVEFLRLADAPDEVRAAAARLRAATVHYFDIGVRGPGAEASQHHWIYFPEPDFIFYRVGSYSAVHAEAAPAGCRSYYVEMSGGIADLLTRPDELRARVLADLRKARVLSAEDEILFMDLRRIPHAYVIFDAHYEASRQAVIDFLAAHGVLTHGRWGGWNYGGMEDAMIEGRAAAAQLAAP